MRTYSILFVVGAVGLSACSGGAVTEPGTNASSIVGGTEDSGDTEVVGFTASFGSGSSGYYSCTAEFITPSVLITAAHCLYEKDGSHGAVPSNAHFSVILSEDATGNSNSSTIELDPSDVHPNPNYDGQAKADNAIIVLHDPVTSITPLAVNTEAIDNSMIGETVRIVGYGITSATSNDAMIRRVTTTTLRKIENNLILVGNSGAQACDGDSGSPAIVQINGVATMIGTDDLASESQDCVGGDLYQRVDLYSSFFSQYAPVTGPASMPHQ